MWFCGRVCEPPPQSIHGGVPMQGPAGRASGVGLQVLTFRSSAPPPEATVERTYSGRRRVTKAPLEGRSDLHLITGGDSPARCRRSQRKRLEIKQEGHAHRASGPSNQL